MTRNGPLGRGALLAAALVAGCGGASSFDCPDRADGEAACAELPGVSGSVGFDDLAYSARLGRVLAPLRGDGVALVDPDSLEATMLAGFGDAGSAAEGAGLVLVADRDAGEIAAVDPATGDPVASAPTERRPDYVRYVEAAGEIWVTEPGSGVEIFRLDADAGEIARVASISTPGGPEGMAVSERRGEVYVHGPGGAILVLDIAGRAVTATWDYDCTSSHGIPALDDERGLLLAGCGADGEVHLIDVEDGRDLGGHATGGGESLMAFSAEAGHFYSRGDPGAPIAVLAAGDGLELLGEVQGSEKGHCLVADQRGDVWTGDEPGGQLIRIRDPY
jgi:hypothetical protein